MFTAPFLLLSFLLGFATANNNFHIEVEPLTKYCFMEPMEVGDFLGVSFQVYGGENLDVDFWVTDPNDLIVQSAFRTSTGSLSVTAQRQGSYSYCISNLGHMGNVEKLVSFAINGPAEQRRASDKKGDSTTAVDETQKVLQAEVQDLSRSIQLVSDEQAYIRSRLVRHNAS
ncbi:p24 complex component [Podochytrium sp. JEL0797]|nr:p24 complex component [Podochytrium sp. JEL0797]